MTRHRQSPLFVRRRGFTLLEMLISVSLVLLIMLLLAQIFGLASDTVSKQKGTAENDQQARTFTTIIRNDLDTMTMRTVIPFYPRPAGTPDEDYIDEYGGYQNFRGYFSYSENSRTSQTDDVLSFTIDTNLSIDTNPMQGRAVVMFDPNASGAGPSDPVWLKDFLLYGDPAAMPADPDEGTNQPEGDDGVVDGSGTLTGALNGVGVSRFAEVSYFVRGGNLYRRVLLLRDPYNPRGTTQSTPTYVDENYPGDYGSIDTDPNDAHTLGSGEFWRDFDYSAYNFFNGTANGPRFNSERSLDNDRANVSSEDLQTQSNGTLGNLSVPLSISTPHRRFGHNFRDDFLGRPREFIRPLDGTVPEDANFNGLLDSGEDGNMNGLLDDEFIGRFTLRETSHADFDYPGTNANPFGRTDLVLNPTNHTVSAYASNFRRGEDILLTNVIEFDVKLWDDGLPNPQFVDLGHNLQDGSGNAIGYYNQANRLNNRYGNRYDTWYPLEILDGMGQSLIVRNDGSFPVSMQRPPFRPYSPGPDGQPGVAGFDDDNDGNTDFVDTNGNSTYDPGVDPLDVDEYGYPGSDDIPVPLKAIAITIRYTDPGSKLVRQVTIVQSLVHDN